MSEEYKECCCFKCGQLTVNHTPDCGCGMAPEYKAENCSVCPKKSFCDVPLHPSLYVSNFKPSYEQLQSSLSAAIKERDEARGEVAEQQHLVKACEALEKTLRDNIQWGLNREKGLQSQLSAARQEAERQLREWSDEHQEAENLRLEVERLTGERTVLLDNFIGAMRAVYAFLLKRGYKSADVAGRIVDGLVQVKSGKAELAINENLAQALSGGEGGKE